VVFFNYAAMQMVAKIVYYGPGLCGKTTNLKLIYDQTTPASRGEIVSLETETDRTLFFDLLPIDVGVVGGFKTKFQLYTVPGQVFYNVTRKLVLKGVDGIVFVADSQAPMLDANVESFQNLKDNLKELGIPIDKTPIVLQYNKRDLSNISPVHEMEKSLNPEGKYVSVQSSALTGQGVFETLKEISRQTLLKLKTKVVDQEERKKRESIVSFKVHTEEIPVEPESLGNLDDIADETISDLGGDTSGTDDTVPEMEGSLPAFNMSDTDYARVPGIGESSLPSVNLSEVDLNDQEFEIDTGEDFIVEDGSWNVTEDDLELDFDLPPQPQTEPEKQPEQESYTPDIEMTPEDGFDALNESDLDSLEMELPALDETIRDTETPPPPPPDAQHKVPPPSEPAIAQVTRTPQVASAPVEKKKVKNQLDELANLTKMGTRRTSKTRHGQDILGNFLSSVKSKNQKSEKKIRIKTPLPFTTAQLNCIFVDDHNNVIHTQLVKTVPKKLANGKKEIRVILEVEEEQS
jgi:signal recognition particle receptor subunit beta